MHSSSYHAYRLKTITNVVSFDEIEKAPNARPIALYELRKKWAPYSMHIMVWLFFYFFPVLIFMNNFDSGRQILTGIFSISYLVPFLMLALFYYLNHYSFIPQLYARKSLLLYFFVVDCCLSVIVFCAWLANTEPAMWPVFNYIVILFLISTAGSIYWHSNVAAQNKKIKQLEVSLLNTRINPHFLFNSLNWIYSLSINSAEETPDAIIQLSGMMRYLIKDVNSDFVELKKELNYIKNYIAIQKGKMDHTLSLAATIPAYSGTLTIAPLLLMSFIENAFKYGINPQEDSAIHIGLSLTGNKLYLEIINNKVSSMYNTGNTGVGIDNARQRLELLYPGMYQLDILDDFKIYSVKLSIILQ